MKSFLSSLLALAIAGSVPAFAQSVLPTISTPSGTYDDQVSLYCTFPEGCAGGVYWTGGGRIIARPYTGPLTFTTDTELSVAGVNADGDIITDPVTCTYTIQKVTAPFLSAEPKPGTARESFYLTKFTWHNATTVQDCRTSFEGTGHDLAWITNDQTGAIVTSSSSLWDDPSPDYKLYISKKYKGYADGQYTLHFAPGAFIVNGEPTGELTATYYVGDVPENPETGNIYTDDVLPDPTADMPQGIGVPDPTLSTPSIHITGSHVELSSTDADVTLKYWINDLMASAQLYAEPFNVAENCLISCVAYNAQGEVSAVANAVVSSYPAEDTGVGNRLLITDSSLENIYVNSLSPNHRYVCGKMQDGNDPQGYLWDLSDNVVTLLSSAFYCEAKGVSDDGTVIGWRMKADPVTGVISTSETYSGWCREGQWTAYPSGWSVYGITGDNRLYGSYQGKPATYNILTGETIIYPGGNGAIHCVTEDGQLLGGSVADHPTLWYDQLKAVTVGDEGQKGAVTLLSGNGDWLMIGSFHRYQVSTRLSEHITSMGAPWGDTFEQATGITDEGLVFGTFDNALYDPASNNMALVYHDGYWQNLLEYLDRERGLDIEGWDLLAGRRISGDGKTMICLCIPEGVSSDDAYVQGMAILMDVATTHLAPTGLTARQMKGLLLNKVSWNEPVSGAEDVQDYCVYRNGALLTQVTDGRTLYYDSDITEGETYSYTVSALYPDDIESNQSYEAQVTVTLPGLEAPRNLSYRQSGINDVNLTWSTPYNVLPALQYYDESDETTAFGSSTYNSEWAIRIPASDLEPYRDLQIRTFQFLPTGMQLGWDIRLYAGQDTVPFYTQRIDTTLQHITLGEYNTIPLDSALRIPEGEDLYVALYIQTAGTDDMLGVSWNGFQAGYTDLCRIEGVHDHFVSIARASQGGTYNLTLPLGVGVCSEEQLANATLTGYHLTMDSQELATGVQGNRYMVPSVSEGRHLFTVSALYASGMESQADTLAITLGSNEQAYVAIDDVDLAVSPGTVTASWSTPLNDDPHTITYCQGNPMDAADSDNVRWQESFGSEIQAASVYTVSQMGAYADDYEITQLYYCPMSDQIEYTIDLMDDQGNYYYEQTFAPGEYVPFEVNYITLPEPITVNGSLSYRLIVDCYDGVTGDLPLALDEVTTSGRAEYSDLFRYDIGSEEAEEGWTSLTAAIAQYDRQLSWYMGLLIHQRNASPMPIDGYQLRIDDAPYDADSLIPADATSFSAGNLSVGDHVLAVDVVYTDYGTVAGSSHPFTITEAQPDTLFFPGEGVYYGGLPADGEERYSYPMLIAQAYQSVIDCSYPDLSIDLTHYMGIGVIDLGTDAKVSRLASLDTDFATQHYHLAAAYDPARLGISSYTMAMYDHWAHPIDYRRPSELHETVTEQFSDPHSGLVVSSVNFQLIPESYQTQAEEAPLELSVTLTETDPVEGTTLQNVTASVQLTDLTGGRQAAVASFSEPVILSHLFTVTVSGLDNHHWLPSSDGKPCINIDGYFNFIGLYGYGDSVEYGVALESGGDVEMYEPSMGGTDGEITFPIETTLGEDDITIASLPDWLSWNRIDGIWNGNWDEYEVLFLMLQADPLPDGVAGRSGLAVFSTQEGASHFTINVRQGSADFAGVNTLLLDSSGRPVALYDLMGRRITRDAARGRIVVSSSF